MGTQNLKKKRGKKRGSSRVHYRSSLLTGWEKKGEKGEEKTRKRDAIGGGKKGKRKGLGREAKNQKPER